MSYVEKNLIPGESVLYKTRLHWIVLFWPVVVALVFGLPGVTWLFGAVVAIGDKSGERGFMAGAGFLLLIVGGAVLGAGILRRNATEMAVTNKRVLVKTGLLGRRTLELLLSKVESIGVDEGVIGRMLGYGTVTVRGTGGTPEPFNRIAHPLEFRRQVQQQIESLPAPGRSV